MLKKRNSHFDKLLAISATGGGSVPDLKARRTQKSDIVFINFV